MSIWRRDCDMPPKIYWVCKIMKDRIKRINELIKEQVANILLREGFFSRDVLVTVQGADTSRDLKYAKIRISVMPSEKSGEILKILEKQTPKIQKELNKIIRIKFVPKIKFEIDRGEQKASRVEEILREIKK